jgi:multidrug efflux pump subunit AcrA (membrane-fusion protein)
MTNLDKTKRLRGGTEQDELTAALALVKAAQAEAAKAKAQAERATNEAMRAKAEAGRERIRADKAYADSRVPGSYLGAFYRPIDIGMRKRLVKTLGMLGSERVDDRASAALIADKERATLGMTWDELIVRVQTDDADDLDFDDEDLEDDNIDDDLDDADLDDDDEEPDDYVDDDDDEPVA